MHPLLSLASHPAHPGQITPPPRAHSSKAPGLLCQYRNELYRFSHLFLLKPPLHAAVLRVKKHFQEGGGAALPELSYICASKWLNWTLIVLTADYAFKLDFLYARSLSLCILHILKGERRRAGGGQLIEGLRVGFFYELRSWLPLVTLHLCTNRRGGEPE